MPVLMCHCFAISSAKLMSNKLKTPSILIQVMERGTGIWQNLILQLATASDRRFLWDCSIGLQRGCHMAEQPWGSDRLAFSNDVHHSSESWIQTEVGPDSRPHFNSFHTTASVAFQSHSWNLVFTGFSLGMFRMSDVQSKNDTEVTS